MSNLKNLKQRLHSRERRFLETGKYEDDLVLKSKDPIRFELLNEKLVQVVTNAHEVAKLVSASPMTRELGEVIFGLYTPEGDSVALSKGLLVHIHTVSRMIKWMISQDYERKVGFSEGDYFFNNDPYIGGAHALDQMIVTPIFFEGEIVGWSAGLTHVPETGGSAPGGMMPFARHRFDEGLFLPCIRIGENDELSFDLEVLVERSTRSPVMWMTDNRAKMTGARMIREQVKQLIEDFGIDYFQKACYEYIEDGRLATQERVRSVLAPGTYREVAWRGSIVPGEETLLHAPLEMSVHPDGRITLSWEGMSPAGWHPFQGTLPALEGLVLNGIIQNLLYDARHNEGLILAVDLEVPEGSAANPPSIYHPTAMWGVIYGAGVSVGQALGRAYYAKGYREEAHASSALSSGYLAGGLDQYGRPFGSHNMEFAAAGFFATAVMDGLDTAGVEFNPEGDMGDAEIWEQMFPSVYLAREIHKDGGGFGKFRGGNGILSLYMVWGSDEVNVGSFGSAPIFSAPGLMGGYPASALYFWIGRDTDLKRRIDKGDPVPSSEGPDPAEPDFVKMVDARWDLVPGANAPVQPVQQYDIFTALTGDGGGFGDPIRRDPMAVAEDLRKGVSGMKTARDVYCVAVDPDTFDVDQAETDRLRAARRRERLGRAIPAQDYRDAVRQKLISGKLFDGDKLLPALRMYQDVMSFSDEWARRFREFWDLPEEFVIQVGEAPRR